MKAIFGLTLILLPAIIVAQENVNVDLVTGKATISVPLTTIVHGDIRQPLSLGYVAEGQRVKNTAGRLGLGWNLNASGAITRKVNDVPDDVVINDLNGWITDGGVAYRNNLQSFNPTSGQDLGDCPGVVADYDALLDVYDNGDLAPDVFSFSFGGYSGNFLFDGNGNIRILPYQELKIEYTKFSSNGNLRDFTITTPDGTKYRFGNIEKTTVSTCVGKFNGPICELVNIPASDPIRRTRDWLIYHNTLNELSYASAWQLTSIESPSGAQLKYFYQFTPGSYTEEYKIATVSEFLRYTKKYTFNNQDLQEIRKVVDGIEKTALKTNDVILYGPNYNEGDPVRKPVTVNVGPDSTAVMLLPQFTELDRIGDIDIIDTNTDNIVKTFAFTYKMESSAGRFLLSSISEVHKDSNGDIVEWNPPYLFSYNSVDFENGVSRIPASDSYEMDYWGFYNGNGEVEKLVPSLYVYPTETGINRIRLYPLEDPAVTEWYQLPGADRTPNAAAAQIGMLNVVQNPLGGQTRIYYEGNDYFDIRDNQTRPGGGVRVRKVEVNAGHSSTAEQVKEYFYTNGTNTSGKLIRRPTYGYGTMVHNRFDPTNFSVAVYDNFDAHSTVSSSYSGTSYWERMITRAAVDLNHYFQFDESSVIYDQVEVAQSGLGKTVYQFEILGSHPLTSDNNNDWNVTQTWIAYTQSCPASTGEIYLGAYAYPFSMNANYEYHRGLLTNEQVFSESGDIQREVTYTYDRIHEDNAIATEIRGLNAEVLNYNVTETDWPILYGQFTLKAGIKTVLTNRIEKVYEPDNSANFVTTTQDRFYQGADHTFLTKSSVTNSDGTINSTITKYVDDFTTDPAATDPSSKALATMESRHMTGLPVETISVTKRTGGTEKVTGGVVNQYLENPIDTTYGPVLSRINALQIDNPLDLTSYNWLAVSNSAYTMDANYAEAQRFKDFSNYSTPQSVIGNKRILSSVFRGFDEGIPLLRVSGAEASQVAYLTSGWPEVPLEASFTGMDINFPQTDDTVNGGVGQYTSLGTLDTLSRSGMSDHPSESYILSFWYGAGSSFDLTVKAIGSPQFQQTYSVASTGGLTNWQYHEIAIQADLPDTYTLEITTDTGIYLDDLFFGPQGSFYRYTLMDTEKGPIAQTDQSGVYTVFEYDDFERVIAIYDDDGNVVQTNDYEYHMTGVDFSLDPGFDWTVDAPNYIATFTPFVVDPEASYDWVIDWEEGTTPFREEYSGTSYVLNYDINTSYSITLTVTKFAYSVSERRTFFKDCETPDFGIVLSEGPFTFYHAEPPPGYSGHLFEVNNINNGPIDAGYLYQWELSLDGQNWNQVLSSSTGPNANQVTVDAAQRFSNFFIRCRVQIDEGQCADSSSAAWYYSDNKIAITVISGDGEGNEF